MRPHDPNLFSVLTASINHRHPTPYTIYTLHPTPYTLHPTQHISILPSTPCTLHLASTNQSRVPEPSCVSFSRQGERGGGRLQDHRAALPVHDAQILPRAHLPLPQHARQGARVALWQHRPSQVSIPAASPSNPAGRPCLACYRSAAIHLLRVWTFIESYIFAAYASLQAGRPVLIELVRASKCPMERRANHFFECACVFS